MGLEIHHNYGKTSHWPFKQNSLGLLQTTQISVIWIRFDEVGIDLEEIKFEVQLILPRKINSVREWSLKDEKIGDF